MPDVCIGNEYGYDLIKRLGEMGVRSNYIMMSGYDEFTYACEALRCGALDYLLKPVDGGKLQKESGRSLWKNFTEQCRRRQGRRKTRY